MMAWHKSLLPAVLIISCWVVVSQGKAIDEKEVNKGQDGDFLQRSKRYIGRVPVAYMKKLVQQPYEEEDEEFASGRQPVPSHFREFQMRQGSSGPQEGDPLTNNLTDEEIQTLLLMLDGYELDRGQGQGQFSRNSKQMRPSSDLLSQPNLDRIAASLYSAQKRETGKRNYENYYNNYEANFEPDRLEFLSEARPKRIGARNLMKSKPNSRVKKETALDAAFPENKEQEQEPKAKKAVDWSNYFGLDKRSAAPKSKSQLQKLVEYDMKKQQNVPTIASTSATKLAKPKSPNSKPGSKERAAERNENETEDKGRPDSDWILREAYRNFAMMTNVKKKRETPAQPANELAKLEELEQQMSQVGDKIIWDAVKFTGAHRDQDLSPQELSAVKQDIVDKLATAYSLEKVREAVDELRAKLSKMEKNLPQM